jgi:hypothetical protein
MVNVNEVEVMDDSRTSLSQLEFVVVLLLVSTNSFIVLDYSCLIRGLVVGGCGCGCGCGCGYVVWL